MSIFQKMSAFIKVLNRDAVQSQTLGNPLGIDSGPFLARKNAMALMTGGRGFTTPGTEPRVHSTFGTTRGQRKRVLREMCAEAESNRQSQICRRMADRSGIPYGQLTYQFGSLQSV